MSHNRPPFSLKVLKKTGAMQFSNELLLGPNDYSYFKEFKVSFAFIAELSNSTLKEFSNYLKLLKSSKEMITY